MDDFYRRWVELMCPYEEVVILCYDSPHLEHVNRFLAHLHNVRLITVSTNDTWIRDYGPLFSSEGDGFSLLDFRFNAWGGKFPFSLDDAVSRQLHKRIFPESHYQGFPMILEGGSVDFDGKGSLLTTRQCLLNPNRSGLAQSEIEVQLKSVFNLQRVLWLDHGMIEGDDTDGHVDTLARFCDPQTICYVQCKDPAYPRFHELQEMERQLQSFVSYKGQPYHLVALPLPSVPLEIGPASYANFIFLNGALLYPQYGAEEDQQIHAIFSTLFPKRQIIGIDCRRLIQQGGALHCASLQVPEGVY